ncbi:MAG: hypothetical protein JXB05_26805 [Myxococcaceae bacterium]|nr:hypothetical protein [Myxococcaceae bacterium]
MYRSLLLLLTLTASTASAQYEEEKPPPKLDGSRRFSLQGGWRYTPNTAFYDDYYSELQNRGLERAGASIGGPLLAGTFGYSPLEWLELSIEPFITYERMRLTNKPGLNALTFGALVGLRLQKLLKIGPEGLVPSIGLLTGPLFAGAYFDGGRSVENFTQAFGVVAGATVRITPKWGLSFDYRLVLAQGYADKIGNYDAGGSWFAVGFNYTLPEVQDRPMNRRF